MESVSKSDPVSSTGRTINMQEAAEILGVSLSTVYRMVSEGELESFKVRNALRTSTMLCEEYIRHQQKRQAVLCKIRKG